MIRFCDAAGGLSFMLRVGIAAVVAIATLRPPMMCKIEVGMRRLEEGGILDFRGPYRGSNWQSWVPRVSRLSC
jgi:hypothetical protein